MKLCKYCKNAVHDYNWNYLACIKFSVRKTDLVKGHSSLKVSVYCGIARREDMCGVEAKHFTPTLKYKVLKFLGVFNGK